MLQNDRRDDSDVAQLRRRVASSPGRFLKHTAGGGVARPSSRPGGGTTRPTATPAARRARPDLFILRRIPRGPA
jgi:hypothetical protein